MPSTGSDLKDTGLGRLPFQTREHNQLWADIALLACDLLAWTALLGLDAHGAAQPKTLRLRLLGVAARLLVSARRRVLKLAADWTWTRELVDSHRRLAAARPYLTCKPRPDDQDPETGHPTAGPRACPHTPAAGSAATTPAVTPTTAIREGSGLAGSSASHVGRPREHQ